MGCHYFKHIPCFRRIMGTDQRSVTLKSPFWTDFRVTLATLFLKRHGYRKGVCCICPNVLSYFMKKLYVFLFCRETALDLKQIWIFFCSVSADSRTFPGIELIFYALLKINGSKFEADMKSGKYLYLYIPMLHRYKYTDREISHGSCFSVKAFRL